MFKVSDKNKTKLTHEFIGQASIRAFAKMGEFTRVNEARRDNLMRVSYARDSCTWWMHSRLDIISAVVLFMTVIFAVFGRDTLRNGFSFLLDFLLVFWQTRIFQKVPVM